MSSIVVVGSPTGQSVGTPALPQPHDFVMLISQYKMRSGSSRDIRANTACPEEAAHFTSAETWLLTQQTTPLFTTSGSLRRITLKWVPQEIFRLACALLTWNVNLLVCLLLLRWGNPLWRKCAGIASTAASSSWKSFWRRSFTSKSPTPS